MILFVDNYDSFTFNLVHMVARFDQRLMILRNDSPEILKIARSEELKAVIISPGPRAPEKSGLCLKMLEILPANVPVLGVCLGHQILAVYGGIKVSRAKRIMHGKTSLIYHTKDSIFRGLQSPFVAGRYHSLIMDEPFTSLIKIIGRSEFNEPMALRYIDRPWFGVQFHPESILTPYGELIIKNFLNQEVKNYGYKVLFKKAGRRPFPERKGSF